MKTLAVGEVKRKFSEVLRDAQCEEVVVTKHGRPIARISGVEGRDIIDVARTDDPAFRQALRNRAREPTSSVEDVAARLGVVLRAPRRGGRRG